MAQLRRDLMGADERMRDLAPDVSAAYREAAAQMPAPGAPPAAPVAPPELPIPAAGTAEIAADVSRQLVAAGRPADEANAAAALVAAHYEARAQRFAGALGAPFELYQREGPRIRGAEAGGPGGLAAGRSTLSQARATITLFRRADASTFIHETGHQWLDELLRDAAAPQAPQQLREDAQTVRNWLGADRTPTRRQHEQFARGFEAYMMEGRAPSPALAGIFAQFRQWLLRIYRGVAGEKLPIIDSVRGVYDRLVGMPEHIVTAPERQLPLGFDEAHMQLSEAAAPHQAEAAAAMIRDERDRAAAAALPGELDAERREDRRAAAPAGGSAPGNPLADREAAGPGAPGEPQGEPLPAGAFSPGRGEIAPAGDRAPAAARARRNPPTAYLNLPPAPLRLAGFLRQAGGLKDAGGELRAREGGAARHLIARSNPYNRDVAYYANSAHDNRGAENASETETAPVMADLCTPVRRAAPCRE